jgi:hypothetical protein
VRELPEDTVIILFTNIEGSTALAWDAELAAGRALTQREAIAPLNQPRGGRLSDRGGPQPGGVKWPGVLLTSMLK